MDTTIDYIRLNYSSVGGANEGAVSVSYETAFTTLFQEVENGYYSCYIPSFDIFYTACSYEDIDILGNGMVESFLQHGLKIVGASGFYQKLKALQFMPSEGVWSFFYKNTNKANQRFSKKAIKIPKDYAHYSKKTTKIANSLLKAA